MAEKAKNTAGLDWANKLIGQGDLVTNLQQAVFGHGANVGSLLPHEEFVHSTLSQIAKQAGLPANFDWWPHLANAAMQTRAGREPWFNIRSENAAELIKGALQSASADQPALNKVLPLVSEGSEVWKTGEDIRTGLDTFQRERKKANVREFAVRTALAFGGGAALGGAGATTGAGGAGAAGGAAGGTGITATAAQGGVSAGLASGAGSGSAAGLGGAAGSGVTATAAQGGLSAGLASAGTAAATALGAGGLGSGISAGGGTAAPGTALGGGGTTATGGATGTGTGAELLEAAKDIATILSPAMALVQATSTKKITPAQPPQLPQAPALPMIGGPNTIQATQASLMQQARRRGRAATILTEPLGERLGS